MLYRMQSIENRSFLHEINIFLKWVVLTKWKESRQNKPEASCRFTNAISLIMQSPFTDILTEETMKY